MAYPLDIILELEEMLKDLRTLGHVQVPYHNHFTNFFADFKRTLCLCHVRLWVNTEQRSQSPWSHLDQLCSHGEISEKKGDAQAQPDEGPRFAFTTRSCVCRICLHKNRGYPPDHPKGMSRLTDSSSSVTRHRWRAQTGLNANGPVSRCLISYKTIHPPVGCCKAKM